ncbi:histidine triad nucleotide binding [Moniliophthora roreri MCA 2997]|uniref:Histidine triad nucleotide binding n=1 Tax=Moniliophthora roreri (strain MCA 2997) TaxID=1381753 RepID=V2WRH1_MONRO|nr:histidine triad nucleotide binding [Moniliophthora roreri MCA 2997]
MLVEDSERRRRKPVTTVTATTTWALTLCSSQHIPALPDDTADFYFESAGASRHTKLDSGFLGPEFDLGNFSRDSYPLQTPRLMIFSLCTLFPFISSNATASLDLESLELPHVKRCAFCDVTTENGFQIVWEDDTFVAFSDRNPACNLHIQLIPRRHIQSVKELTKSDAKLLKSMAIIGHQLLDISSIPTNMRRLGFHIPPFNSVNHLHLHVQALPYKSIFRRAKYPVASGNKSRIKGLTWFVTVDQAIRTLEDDQIIRVLPCYSRDPECRSQ